MLAFLIALILPVQAYAQDVLIDDLSDTGDFSLYWSNQTDTLEAYGVTVHRTTIEGWTGIMEMDMLWLISPFFGSGDTSMPYTCTPYSDSTKALMRDFVRFGGNLLICVNGDAYEDEGDMPVVNDLLLDSAWETTLEVLPK